MQIRENFYAKQQLTSAAQEQNGSMDLVYLLLMVSQRRAKSPDQVGNGHVNQLKVVASSKYYNHRCMIPKPHAIIIFGAAHRAYLFID